MVVLEVGGVLMSEVPLYSFSPKMSVCFWGEMKLIDLFVHQKRLSLQTQ